MQTDSWEFAATALSQIGPQGAIGAASLLANTNVPDRWRFVGVIEAAREKGTDITLALPTILRAQTESDPVVSREAKGCVSTLVSYCPEEPSLLRALTTALVSADKQTQLTTLQLLQELGRGARSFSECLQGFLRNPDPDFRELATNALRAIDPQAFENVAPSPH
jgi:hypothetical protein